MNRSAIWAKIKSAASWAWSWITIIAVTALSTLAVGLDYLEQLSGVDLTQIMTQRRAAQITFGVAITKAVVTAYQAQKAKT